MKDFYFLNGPFFFTFESIDFLPVIQVIRTVQLLENPHTFPNDPKSRFWICCQPTSKGSHFCHFYSCVLLFGHYPLLSNSSILHSVWITVPATPNACPSTLLSPLKKIPRHTTLLLEAATHPGPKPLFIFMRGPWPQTKSLYSILGLFFSDYGNVGLMGCWTHACQFPTRPVMFFNYKINFFTPFSVH